MLNNTLKRFSNYTGFFAACHLTVLSCLAGHTAFAQTDSLSLNFKQPTNQAKPMVWWFWGESTITEHGITKDLEALKKVGFGGVVLYEQVFKDDPDALKSLSSEWLSRVRFAAAECARLGIRLEVNSSNGYVAGGPWITPELGMQRLVSSETVVQGGKHLSINLTQPPTKLNYYKDVAILAFPSVKGQVLPQPVINSEPKIENLPAMFNTSISTRVKVSPAPGKNHTFINLDYGQVITARSISYGLRPSTKALIIATEVPGNWSKDFYGEGMQPILPIGELEASTDHIHWRVIKQLPGRGYQFENWDRQTLSFLPVTARYFRLNLHDWGYNERSKDYDLQISSVSLQGAAKIDQWEEKSGNTNDFPNPDQTPAYKPGEVVNRKKIIDLTGMVSADGHLDWNAPAGNWTILRFGHTPTGVKTKHGRPEGLGLECDKLSTKAATVQFDNYVGVILREVRKVPGAVLAGVNMDSAEHGSQNWTADFATEFLKMYGYDLKTYLPAMAGYVVDDRETSDRFLFDMRRAIANLMSEKYYGTFKKLCNAQGMTFMAEAPGIATCMPSDNIQAKGNTDIPMAEFWMTQADGTMDCKEAASAAHVYGKNIVAAEAFTGSKADATPAMMKPLADAALIQGINRFAVLAYMHQPWDDRKPGVTEDRFYLPYQRHNTWWDDSGVFWNTLSRSSQMMLSGHPIADILYYLGNDAPIKIAPFRMRPVPPTGYDYDVCSDEILLRTTVKNGLITLPSGMTYKLLVLDGGQRLTFAAMQHICELVKHGATVLGQGRVNGSASLADGTLADSHINRLAMQLWGPGALKANGEKRTGAGQFFWGIPPEDVLKRVKLVPDFQAINTATPDDILYSHRKAGQNEIYLVVNHANKPLTFNAVFRVANLQPQLWNPENGVITGLNDYRKNASGATIVPLQLEAHQSVFIVFRKQPIPVAEPLKLVESLPVWRNLDKPWKLQFAPNLGAPNEIELNKLISWTAYPDFGVQHYAGTATYRQEFNLDAIPAGKIVLDLGEVNIMATVKINGVACPTLWKAPYAVDITKYLKQGNNQLEISVTNLWVNRLIADAGLPPGKRISWVTYNSYKPGDELLPSGLIGPVVLKLDKL